MVIAESLAMGTPVVATDVGGFALWYRTARTDLCSARRYRGMADKLLLVLQDDALRTDWLKPPGIQPCYHPDVVVCETMDVYKQYST